MTILTLSALLFIYKISMLFTLTKISSEEEEGKNKFEDCEKPNKS
jgi:hypothetical protein